MAAIAGVGKKGHHTYTLTVNEVATDVNSNTSTISYSFTLYGGSYDWASYGTKISFTINIDGQIITGYIPNYPKNQTLTVASGQLTIWHNNDGSRTGVYYAFSVVDNANKTYTSGNASASGTFNLSTIPRASSFSYSGTTLGSATSISINRASSSFTHTVVYSMGGISQSYGGIGTSTSFTRPYSDANQFGANSASGIGVITVITYNGGQEIGRTAQNIVMTLPDNNDTKPVKNSNITISDSNSSISEKFGKFIQGNTRLLFGFDFTARYGATIREYNLIINDENITNANNSILTGVLKSSGNINYTYKVKDSRGRTYTESGVVPVSEYNKPIINVEIERNTEGTAAQVHITAAITALDNKNDKIASIRYKPHNSQGAYVSEVVQFGNGYTLDKTINIPIAEDVSYDFYATVSDFFATEQTSIIPISTVYDLLHFRNDGEGIAIGKRSERKAFEVGMDMYYKGQTLEDYIKSVIDNYR